MSVTKWTLYRKCSSVNIQVIQQLVINALEGQAELLMNGANLSGTLLPSLRGTTDADTQLRLQPRSLPEQGVPMVARPPLAFPPPWSHIVADSNGQNVCLGPANLFAKSPVP